MLLAFVMFLTGIIPSGAGIQTVKAADTTVVWFEYADGTIQNLDDNNTITLKTTDKGYFRCNGVSGWQCKYQVPGISHSLIVKETGEFSYNDAISVPYTFRNAEAFDSNYDTIKKFNLTIEEGEEEVKADTTALKAAIYAAAAIQKGNYTDDSWAELIKALNAAQKVLDDTSATQEQVDAAKTALETAVSTLKEKVNTTVVWFEYADGTIQNLDDNNTITLKTTDKGYFRCNGVSGWQCKYQAPGVSHSLIVKETGEFSYNSAISVPYTFKNAEAFDANYDTIKKFNLEIVASEEEVKVDTTALKAAIDKAEAIAKGNYTDDSWNAMQAALTAAKDVLANTSATQDAVDAAVTKLNNAVSSLAETVTHTVVYFQYSDGTTQDLDSADTITIKATDKGSFKCDAKNFKGWQCTYRAPGVTHVLINKETGEFSYNSAISVPYTFKRAEAFDTNYDTIKYFNLVIEEGDAQVDKTALDSAISAAEAKKEADYTADSWKIMQDALTAAKAVQADETATQDTVDAAAEALNTAVSNLKQAETMPERCVYFEYADGSKSEPIEAGGTLTLKMTAQGYFRLNGNKGGDAHWNGCMSMDTGAFISLGKVKTSDCTVNAGDWSFRIKFTVRIVADTDALKAAIAAAETIEKNGKGDYTDASWSNFGIALINARTMLDDADTDDTEQANINNAANALTTAIQKLKKNGELDKDALNVAIAAAEAKQESNYTSATWKSLSDALAAAKAADAKADATQEEIDKAAADLNTAVSALVEKGDKTALNAAIATVESKNKADYTEETWSAVETALKAAKEIAAKEEPTKAEVDATAKALNSAISSLKEKENAVVYFQRNDGTRVDMDANGVFTLKSTDAGAFKVEGRSDVYWNCESIVNVKDPNTGNVNTKIHYWIKYSTGAFDGSAGAVDSVQATAVDSADKVLRTFKLKVTVDKYAELKAYIGDKEVTADDPYHVKGTDKVSVTIKGRKEGEDTFNWIDPAQLTVKEENTNAGRYDRVNKTYCVLTENTKAVFTVSLTADSSVSTSFTLYSDPVAIQDFSVHMPSVWYIDAWNGLVGGQYAGINNGNGDTEYSVSFVPYNTSNQKLIWKNLAPEIAEYSEEAFAEGIVPKKAGVAKFEVSSAQNPEIKHEVSVEFKYKYPLTTANTNATLTLDKDATQSLEIAVVPTNATEQRFNWTYSEDGIVEVTDSVYQDPNSVLTPKVTSHSIQALKAGVVTVTGTPYDQTGNCAPVVFTVKVNDNTQTGDKVDVDKIVRDGIRSASSYLNTLGYQYECGGSWGAADWYVMSKLRTGQTVSETNKEKYYNSAVAKVATWNGTEKPTDIERVALTLSAMGKDITDVGGVNLAAMIYNSDRLMDGSNELSWGLLALDATAQEIPADAKWSRESMVDALLGFQNENGGFGLFDNKSADVDMTGMILQALAPYAKGAKVQTAVTKALSFLKNKLDDEYGYTSSETTAQVIMALACLKLDPIENGFATEYEGIISTLEKNYAVKTGGYSHDKNGAVNAMASYQTMEAYEAYRRFKASEEGYWDMRSLQPSKPDAAVDAVIDMINALPAADKVTLADKDAIAKASEAYDALTDAQKEKVGSIDALTKAEAQIKALEDAAKDDGKKDDDKKDDTKPSKPEVKDTLTASAVSVAYNKVQISWTKAADADGYRVYRANSKNGTYRKAGTVKAAALSYTNKGLTAGKTYYYKVRAYKNVNGKKVWQSYSNVVSVKAVPAKTTFTKATAGHKKATLKWKKVNGATRYLVYRSTSKNSRYTCVKSLKGTTYTNKKLTAGKTYYYKVRAYRMVGGKKVYGAYSAVRQVKVK